MLAYRKVDREPAQHVRLVAILLSAAAERGNGGTEALIHRKHVSTPKHIIIMLSDSRRLVVRLPKKHCQLDLIVLHAPAAGQTSESKNQASL